MFQLLQPIWLFALAGLAVPVVIYLWNQRPGKILRVGSVALVAANRVAWKKAIKPSDWLLLLLRCLLLACIAVALAAPVWKSPFRQPGKGWVLVPKATVKETYTHFKPLMDSLLQAGLELHYFEEGFAADKLNNALQQAADTTAAGSISYRALIAALDDTLDGTLPVYVFTDNYLQHFAGSRSAVSLNLHWFVYTPAKENPVAATDTTAPLHITIYSRRYSNDARYIKAGLDAIQSFTKKNIIITMVADSLAIPPRQHWVFWLDDETPGVGDALHLLQYTPGSAVATNSHVLPNGGPPFAAIDLYRRVMPATDPDMDGQVIWKDGFGHPLLTLRQQNATAHYKLYTHINPNWNGLPWSGNFPQLLWQLIATAAPVNSFANSAATTLIDKKQLLPIIVPEKQAGKKPSRVLETNIGMLFWVLAIGLFFLERLLSLYPSKTNSNG